MECSIDIEYTKNAKQIREHVCDYLMQGSGKKIEYHIGEKNNQGF